MKRCWRALGPLLLIGWLSGCLLTLETIHYRPPPDAGSSDAHQPDVPPADGNYRDVRRNDRVIADEAADVLSDEVFADRQDDIVAEDAAAIDEDAALAMEDVRDVLAEDIAPDVAPDVASDVQPDIQPDASADAADSAMPVDAADVVDVPADVPADVPVDVPVDVPPPPPPVSILFRHSTDVPRFEDYVVRWGHTDTTLSGWSTGHCPSGIIALAIPDNWSQCDLDLPLAPGDVLDFYPLYPGGAEVCGSGGPCPSVFNERFTVRQGARDYLGTVGAVSLQSESVAGHAYRYLRVYL